MGAAGYSLEPLDIELEMLEQGATLELVHGDSGKPRTFAYFHGSR
jgi:hypothetical protein